MNWMDLIMIMVILLAAWEGFRSGFINGAADLLVWGGSLLIAFISYSLLGSWLRQSFPQTGVWAYPAAFIGTILLCRIILRYFSKIIIAKTTEETNSSIVNKALGIIPGVIKGLLYVTLVSSLLMYVPTLDISSLENNKSGFIAKLKPNIQRLAVIISPVFNQVIQKSFDRNTIEPEANETIQLHYHLKEAPFRPDLENKMLQLVNEERQKRGLHALAGDSSLVSVGRSHAKDMFARGYFSHYTPEGRDPFDRMKASGIRFISAGENLALGQTLMICHDGLMNSPGHRANILNPSFGRLGIGIIDGGVYGLMITQEFRN